MPKKVNGRQLELALRRIHDETMLAKALEEGRQVEQVLSFGPPNNKDVV